MGGRSWQKHGAVVITCFAVLWTLPDLFIRRGGAGAFMVSGGEGGPDGAREVRRHALSLCCGQSHCTCFCVLCTTVTVTVTSTVITRIWPSSSFSTANRTRSCTLSSPPYLRGGGTGNVQSTEKQCHNTTTQRSSATTQKQWEYNYAPVDVMITGYAI